MWQILNIINFHSIICLCPPFGFYLISNQLGFATDINIGVYIFLSSGVK